MVALKHIPKHLRSAKAREWAHRSNAVQAARRIARGVDAETARRRALDDARGAVLREGCTYTTAGDTQWQVRRSITGRSDQFDLVANGEVARTAGKRRLPLRFRPKQENTYCTEQANHGIFCAR